ncbi:MAG: thrombospondin type 3 repeat-containing protein [Patescibacteria group bacterium]
MFENKKEPQDIFEGVEPPANLPVAGQTAPAAAAASVRPGPQMTAPTQMASGVKLAPVIPGSVPPPTGKIVADRHTSSGGHLWKTLLIVFIAFAATGLVAFVVFKAMNPADTSVDLRDGSTAGESDDTAELPDGKGGGGAVIEEPEVLVVVDSDGDGLTDAEEQAAGTNSNLSDTDSDLLGDREEVQVYGTDPLRADSDADGFSDGQEVQSGYNPNGPGKLLEIPTN